MHPATQVSDDINKALKLKLSEKKIEFEPSSLWYLQAQKVLRLIAVCDVNLTIDEFTEWATLIMHNGDLTYYQFAGMNNMFEHKTAKDLSMHIMEFLEFQKEVEGYAKLWSEQTEKLRQDTVAEIVEKYKPKSN